MNRQRFDEHGFVSDFFDYVVREAILADLVSQDHFSVDGTLIQSFASMKSLRPIDTEDNKVSDRSDDDDPGNPTVNFRGERRSNKTHRRMETQATKRSDRRVLQPLENGPTGADGLIRNGIAEPRRRIAKAESNENTHPNQHHRSPGMKNSTANPLSPPLFSSLLDL